MANTKLYEEVYKHLNADKIKMNWNKNPIKVDLILSFLTVTVIRSHDHLGYSNGWTLHKNEGIKLYIHGGWVKGVEYLDYILFGEKLANNYNNYVSPFYIFDILTREGQAFFIDYYKDDIAAIFEMHHTAIENLQSKLDAAKVANELATKEINDIKLSAGMGVANG